MSQHGISIYVIMIVSKVYDREEPWKPKTSGAFVMKEVDALPYRSNIPCKHPGCAALIPHGQMYCCLLYTSILIFEDEKEHQRFRIYVRENWYRKDAFANDIWIPHMEQLPGYNMDAFREEYLNMQILRKMLEEFRKNDNTKN